MKAPELKQSAMAIKHGDSKQEQVMVFIDGVKDWIKRSVTPPKLERRDGVKYWQDRIIFTLLLIGVFLGFFVYVPSVWLSIAEDLWIVAVTDSIIYFGAAYLFFKRSLSFHIRAFSLVSVSYLLGMILILTLGPYGAGPVWLFLFPVITALFFNLRYTLTSLAINAFTLVVLGLSLGTEWINWQFSEGFPVEAWAIVGLNFILLNVIIAVSIGLVINGLQNSLEVEKQALASLERKNLELNDSNKNLLNVIHERERVEKALQKSEKALEASEIRFKDLVNLLPLSYFLIDDSLTLKYLNKKAYEMFQISSLEFNGGSLRKITDLLLSVEHSRIKELIEEMVLGQEPGWIRFLAQASDGSQFPVEILASRLTISEKTAGIQLIIVDISERLEIDNIKKDKEIAEETSKAVSDWVSFIAHELRTPISGLLHFSQLGLKKINESLLRDQLGEIRQALGRNPTDNQSGETAVLDVFEKMAETIKVREERFSRSFDRIYLAGNRLVRLLNELLDLSKLETGKMQFSLGKVNLLEIVREAVNEVEAMLEEKKMRLTVQDVDFSTDIVCDEFRIGQVFRNLINNSIKFSGTGTTISISFKQTKIMQGRRQGDDEIMAIQTTVEDQGFGIPDDQVEMIFNKFRQSRKTKIGEGSGLGLPICKEIIVGHSGKIWAESQENSGTKMQMVLPYQNIRAL